jgi:DNA invertase Pin-like site-specific DNA recombinase
MSTRAEQNTRTGGVGIYVRISSDKIGAGIGVENQRADCDNLRATEQLPAAELYVDNDLTANAPAGKLPRRPAYARLVEDITARRITTVIVWHTDRLHRTPRELEDLIDLVELNPVTIRTVKAGFIELSTPAGRAVARTLCAWAKYESEHKADRVRLRARAKAEHGEAEKGGNLRPFGYDNDRVTVVEEEAAEVRWMCDQILSGVSFRGIAADLTRRGIPTISGAHWQIQTIQKILLSPRIAGLRAHRGEIVATGKWPALVDRDRWEAVRAVINQPGRTRHYGPRKYLLTGGTAVCGLCGKPLTSKSSVKGTPGLVCSSGAPGYGCGKIRITTLPLEDYVAAWALERLARPELVGELNRPDQPDTSALVASIERDEWRLDALAAAFSDTDADPVAYRKAAARVTANIDDARRKLRALTTTRHVAASYDPATITDKWPNIDLDRQRALLRLVVDRVEIGPARRGLNRFDDSRVTIVPALR